MGMKKIIVCLSLFVCVFLFKNYNCNASKPVYVFYHMFTGEHLYTSNLKEAQKIDSYYYNWNWEGYAFAESENKEIPVYRLYNKYNGKHYYTKSIKERNKLNRIGWQNDFNGSPAFYQSKNGDNVYKLYNKNNGEHYYTTKNGERNKLIGLGWRNEGVAWKTNLKYSNPPTRDLYGNSLYVRGSYAYYNAERRIKWDIDNRYAVFSIKKNYDENKANVLFKKFGMQVLGKNNNLLYVKTPIADDDKWRYQFYDVGLNIKYGIGLWYQPQAIGFGYKSTNGTLQVFNNTNNRLDGPIKNDKELLDKIKNTKYDTYLIELMLKDGAVIELVYFSLDKSIGIHTPEEKIVKTYRLGGYY